MKTKAKGHTVTGSFDVQKVFNLLSDLIEDQEGVRIEFTVTEKEETEQKVVNS